MSIDMYDHLPPLEAALAAWSEPGRFPGLHEAKRRLMRTEMPLLARSLDRAEQERKNQS